MPTGYTAGVVDGKITDFKVFAMQCARAFGALIELRDQSISAPIPKELKPSSHYTKALKKAKAEYFRLISMTKKQQLAYGQSLKKRAIQASRQYLATSQLENDRINSMLVKVGEWASPSPEHDNMKKFMIEQLTSSFHDSSWSKEDLCKQKAKTPKKIYEEAKANALRDITYYQDEVSKESKRIAEQNIWIKLLRESLE